MSRLCLNCGKPNRTMNIICPACDDAGNKLTELLTKGITLEYKDGTKQTIKLPKYP